MVKSIVIVGSTDVKTAEYYKKLGILPSVLITDRHHNQLIAHTSVGDINDLDELEYVLKQFDKVFWAECDIEEFANATSYYDFLDWLKDFNLKYRTVENLHKINHDVYDWNTSGADAIGNDQAVFFGCSFTAGVALPYTNTHYASIVAKHFNKELCNLAVGGSSNSELFHRFTQVDLHPGQIVVVQLTNPNRLFWSDEQQQLHRLMFTNTAHPKLSDAMFTVYNKDFLFLEILQKVRAMVKIARAKKCRMVFWLIDYKNEMVYSRLDQRYFYNMPEFVPASWMQNYYIDTATDLMHPGVKSNQFIADTLIRYIETIYGKN